MVFLWESWKGVNHGTGSRDGQVGVNTRAISEKASQHLVADSMQERKEIYSIDNISGRSGWVGGAIM